MPDVREIQNDDVFGVEGVEEVAAQTASEEVVDKMISDIGAEHGAAAAIAALELRNKAEAAVQQFWFYKFAHLPLRNRHQGIHSTGAGDASVQINGYSEMAERLAAGWRVQTVQMANSGLEVFVALVNGC